MKQIRLNRRIMQSVAPLACATLIAACASYDHRESVYGRDNRTPVDTPVALFDRLDTNRDGFLSRGEVEPLGIATVAAPVESATAMFDRLDTNRDGFLSPGEAGTVFAPIPGGSFAAFDTDRDGFLSRTEAAPLIGAGMFERYDTNRDDFLSRSEAEPMFGTGVGATDGYRGGTVRGTS